MTDKYNLILIFFIILFFPSFVTGVFLPNLIIFLIITTTLLIKFKELKKLFTEYSKLFLYFMFFYLLIFLSSIFSKHVIHSLETSLLYFAYLLLIFSFIVFFRNHEKNIIFFFYCGISSFFIISIDAVYEIINGSNILGFSSIDGRIAGLFNDRWVIGSYLVRFTPVLLGIFFINFQNFSNFQRSVIFIIFGLSSVIIVLSGERVAYLLLFLLSVLIVIFIFFKIKSKRIIFISIFSILLLFSSPFYISEKISERLQSNLTINFTNFDPAINQYYALYKTSYNLFTKSPLFGIGPNNFRKECDDADVKVSKYSCSTHPHNTYFQLLAETGIIGFSLISYVFLYFVVDSFKSILYRKFDYGLFGFFLIKCSFVINLWPLIPTGNFFNSWLGYIYFLPFPIYLIYKNTSNEYN